MRLAVWLQCAPTGLWLYAIVFTDQEACWLIFVNLPTTLIAGDIETRLPRPTQQLGRDAAWMHGGSDLSPPVHSFGAVPMRCALLAVNEAQPRDKTETGWTVQRITGEGFLPAGREKGAA